MAGVVKEPLFSPEELSQLWAGPIVARADGIACQVFPTAFQARGREGPPSLRTWRGVGQNQGAEHSVGDRGPAGSGTGRSWFPGRHGLQIEVEEVLLLLQLQPLHYCIPGALKFEGSVHSEWLGERS